MIGCGIGEVLGMMLAASMGWHGVWRIIPAVILAFFFGYLLTYRSVKKHELSVKNAIKITLATDTVSITTMEIIDNGVALLIPGALMVSMFDPHFWISLAISLGVAFIVTVPVNRFMIARNPHSHRHMH